MRGGLSQVHLFKTVEHSDRLTRPGFAGRSEVPPCRTIPGAPSAGGKPARCSRPPSRRRSASWSCRERCTLGSTGSA